MVKRRRKKRTSARRTSARLLDKRSHTTGLNATAGRVRTGSFTYRHYPVYVTHKASLVDPRSGKRIRERGLFARRDLKKQEIVLKFGGTNMSFDSPADKAEYTARLPDDAFFHLSSRAGADIFLPCDEVSHNHFPIWYACNHAFGVQQNLEFSVRDGVGVFSATKKIAARSQLFFAYQHKGGLFKPPTSSSPPSP